MDKIRKISRIVKVMLLTAGTLNLVLWLLASLMLNQQIQNSPADTLNVERSIEILGIDMSFIYEGDSEEEQSIYRAGYNSILLGSAAEITLQSLICLFLYRLFSDYQKGQIFSPSTSNHLRRVGLILVMEPLVTMIYINIVLVTLRLSGALEVVELNFGLRSTDLFTITAGLMIYVISWIMMEAAIINEEQELTI